MQNNFHSNGKLLLTSEFLVIDGAQALALPCQYGQSLSVETLKEPEILWESYTDEGKRWFEAIFSVQGDQIKHVPYASEFQDEETAQRLVEIFQVLKEMKPDLFTKNGYAFKSRLEFPQIWGLGSSSTLLNNLATWAGVDAYELSDRTFGGSAYDIACAQESSPLIYQRISSTLPKVDLVDFDPEFKDELFFVHLNQKQNTREVVQHYKALNESVKEQWIAQAEQLTNQFLNCKTLTEFEGLMVKHEHLLSEVLAMKPIKQLLFPDFTGAVKSLGAWGGDFALATGGEKEKDHFKEKGYNTILSYSEMVL